MCLCVCVFACACVRWLPRRDAATAALTVLLLCSVAVVQALSFQQRALSYLLQLNPGNLFSIHQQSGALSLTRPVDFEAGANLHSLQVRASEAESGLSSVAEVLHPITEYSFRKELQ